MAKEESVSLVSGNISAVRTVMSAIEGTIGPKGLDTMLLDPFGNVTITNDGYTILSMMDATHPVTKLLIHAVKAQQEEIGDGTTTTALIATALILGGYRLMENGVAIAHLLEGLEEAKKEASKAYKDLVLMPKDEAFLKAVSKIAGRGDEAISEVVVEAMKLVGEDLLKGDDIDFSEMVQGVIAEENTVLQGLVIEKEPFLANGVVRVNNPKVLIIDDALDIEMRHKEMMHTETGFAHYMALEKAFYELVEKIIASGAKAVFVQRGLDKKAEAIFSEHGIYTLSRVRLKDIKRLARHSGAKALSLSEVERLDLTSALGTAGEIYWDKAKETTVILGGGGEEMATILIAAQTKEILDERVRIAKDATASLQSALKKGLVYGGGASELYVARQLREKELRETGLKKVGYTLLAEALEKPFCQMVENAGYHSMEKKALVDKAQIKQNTSRLGLDFASGEVTEMDDLGIYDAVAIKENALNVAVEVAKSILKINVIVRKKAHQSKERGETLE